jgi:pyrroline-5-carboxylate reductase
MSYEELRIGFIGGGNMAQALVAGLLRAGHRPERLHIAEPAEAARARLAALHSGLRLTATNADVAVSAAVLVLAVKPQVMPAVAAEVAGRRRPPGQLVVSIAAGVTLGALHRWLGADTAAVRVMPNQPALVGEGMAVLVSGPEVSDDQRAAATYVAGAAGRTAWIADESLMDAVTAISGSGPAYFYLLMEMIEDSAVRLGLPPDTARVLTRQTALGAARVAADPAVDLAAMRASVTSPGGTTAAALGVLDEAGVRDIFRRALQAARDRGAELGRGDS